MFGRRKAKRSEGLGGKNLFSPILGAALSHYVAGPGLHVGLERLPEGAESDWDEGVNWEPSQLHRILVVHIPGTLGWISFLQRPDGCQTPADVDSATRLSNPLTVKYTAEPREQGELTAEEMKATIELADLSALEGVGTVEIEVRASRSDSVKWAVGF